ncbi:MAG: hypothetical protein AYK23_00380 [Candidatus Proteinoplasmatales archaeon SG8-5]|nr:MAG: hypothetical protein AYK23_00380 [Candidatus Proteinoplasmatales archaeon SG8-5]
MVIAFSVRLAPLHESPMPYNIDGFPLARISESIIDTEHIPSPSGYEGLIGYNLKLPIFSLVLTCFSLVLGVEPLTLLPYFCALIGSMAVLFIYVLTLHLTQNRLAGFVAGLFAALTGLFVYVTTAAMKQLLAIVLLVFAVYLFTRREDWRCRLLMVVTLIMLPFTHHLTTLIALLILSTAIGTTAIKGNLFKLRALRSLALDVVTGPLILILSLAYYRSVNLEFVNEVGNINDVVLLGSVFILLFAAAKLISETAQSKPWFFLTRKDGQELGVAHIFDEKVLIFVVGIGTLYLNSRIKVFTGSVMTTDTLFNLMFPYLILTVIGLIGFNVLRYSRFPRRDIIIGMFMAPFCVMVFAVLRGLDIFNFTLVYRSYNFIDVPMAIVVGVGAAYLFTRMRKFTIRQREFRVLPYGVLAVVGLLCVASVPLAYNSEEAFGIQEITYPYEFEGLEWVAEANVTAVVTDQRYGDIIEPYFGVDADRTGPWRMKSQYIDTGDVILISNYWTDGGAQMSILGREYFTDHWLEDFYDNLDFNIVYVGGPEGREVVVAIAG